MCCLNRGKAGKRSFVTCACTAKLWTPIPFSLVCCDGFVNAPYLPVKQKTTFPKNLMQGRSHPPLLPWDVNVWACFDSCKGSRSPGAGHCAQPAAFPRPGKTSENLICWKITSWFCHAAVTQRGEQVCCIHAQGLGNVSWGLAGGGAIGLNVKINPLIFLPIPVPPL